MKECLRYAGFQVTMRMPRRRATSTIHPLLEAPPRMGHHHVNGVPREQVIKGHDRQQARVQVPTEDGGAVGLAIQIAPCEETQRSGVGVLADRELAEPEAADLIEGKSWPEISRGGVVIGVGQVFAGEERTTGSPRKRSRALAEAAGAVGSRTGADEGLGGEPAG